MSSTENIHELYQQLQSIREKEYHRIKDNLSKGAKPIIRERGIQDPQYYQLKAIESEEDAGAEALIEKLQERLLEFEETDPEAFDELAAAAFRQFDEEGDGPGNFFDQEEMDALVPFSTGATWENYIANQVITPDHFFEPKNLEELQQAVNFAKIQGRSIRMPGSGHSFSEIALSQQVMISPKRLTGILDNYALAKNGRILRAGVDKEKFVEVECGMTVRDLNRQLQEREKSLAVMGAYNGQTVMGVVATSTHGASLTIGPVPNLVRSLLMFDGDGQLIRLEPFNGITQRERHQKEFPHIRLVHDDKAFYAAVVSMGCIGLVYAVTFEVEPLFRMEENRIPIEWNALKAKLQSREFPLKEGYDDYSFSINPFFSERKGRRYCLQRIRKRTNKAPSTHGERRRSFWTGLAYTFRFLAMSTGRKLIEVNDKEKVAKRIDFILRHQQDKKYIAYNHEVLVTVEKQPVKGYALELAFSLDNYVEGLEKILEVINDMADTEGKICNAPLSVRYVAPGTAFLSPQCDRFSVMIEIPLVHGTRDGFDMLKRIQRELGHLKPRPHWGLQLDQINRDNHNLDELYPKFAQWREVYREFNKNRLYSNPFTKRLGLDDERARPSVIRDDRSSAAH